MSADSFAAGPPQGETRPLGGQRSTRSGKRGGNIVFFDLDHTLLSGDSDVLWCDFLIAQGLLDAAGFGAQNADMDVPIATMQLANMCTLFETCSLPYSITPKKLASKKNAVMTSKPNNGPAISPAFSIKPGQLVPN